MNCICAQCGKLCDKKTAAVNRAKKVGAPLYCDRNCAGLARRRKVELTPEQKKAAKSAYDKQYRLERHERIKAKKRAWYEANNERIAPVMAAYRKKRMPKHVEYCRQPEYRAKKYEYDRQRNESEYGEWAEVWRLLQDLEKEISSQATAYERRVANGYYTRNAQKRRRELCQLRKNQLQCNLTSMPGI